MYIRTYVEFVSLRNDQVFNVHTCMYGNESGGLITGQ